MNSLPKKNQICIIVPVYKEEKKFFRPATLAGINFLELLN